MIADVSSITAKKTLSNIITVSDIIDFIIKTVRFFP